MKKGFKMSLESRMKLSNSKKGKSTTKGYKHTEEARMKMSLAKKGIKTGRKLTEDHKQKMSRRGSVVSEESRLKMSLAKKGKIPAGWYKIQELGNPAWNKGLTSETDDRIKRNVEKGTETRRKLYSEGKLQPWNLGMKIDREMHPNMGHKSKHTPEALAKMKAARKGKSAYWNRGDKSPMWKGGSTPELKKIRKSIEFASWRETVFARDNWTCQKYKIRGGKLHPHHILNFGEYPELRFDVNNGVTLSDKAHIEFHKKYGKSNNTREQLKEFLSNEK